MNHKQIVESLVQEVFEVSRDSYALDTNISALHTSANKEVRQAKLDLLAKRLCDVYPTKDMMALAETAETVGNMIEFLET